MNFQTFLLIHPWIGWIAFFALLAVFIIFIIVQYIVKKRMKSAALSQIKNATENDSMKEKLIAHGVHSVRRPAEYHRICSDDELSIPSVSQRSTPAYPSLVAQPLKLPISQRKDSIVGHYSPKVPLWKPTRTRDALRQIYPSDVSSVGSESSRSFGRPLSYRDMRRSNPNSPTVTSPYARW
jgi:hypothetical protein